MTIHIVSEKQNHSQSRDAATSSHTQSVFWSFVDSNPHARVHPGTQLWWLCAVGGQAKALKPMPIPIPTPWDREPSKLKSMLCVSIKSLSRMESTSQSTPLGAFSISNWAAILLWEFCCWPWYPVFPGSWLL